MLKLYYSPGSCALASRIALEEADAPYELVRLDFSKSEQRGADYLKINPKGRVPALSTDRGVLTENPAILAYIAQSFPAAKLAPLDDAFAFGQVQAFNAYLAATVHVAHAHGPRGSRWADDPAAIAEMKRKVPETVAACFELIEEALPQGGWVMGGQYTICDPYLFTIASWLESDGVDVTRFPKVLDHRNRMAERPAVKKAQAI
ncbi:glutathione S-transferase family protein [Dongia soli]|uniref:Glutathione S-transferase family protein n=1 Tax=Dongia soli TaxID=600628 RepID=A0ABU5EDY7_9PROT|nr:glutathione S-transferase family protein [Dongia soli]MDY0884522.1 glutathione S-transferase family protein [Dongia soli]